jgi:hypothetical protein
MYLVFSSVLLFISAFIYYKSTIKEKNTKDYMKSVDTKLQELKHINDDIHKRADDIAILSNQISESEKQASSKNIKLLEYESFSQKETIKWIFLNFVLDLDLMTKHADIYNVIYFRLRESEPEFIESVIDAFSDGDISKIKEMISEVSNSMILLAPVESNGYGIN